MTRISNCVLEDAIEGRQEVAPDEMEIVLTAAEWTAVVEPQTNHTFARMLHFVSSPALEMGSTNVARIIP